MAFYIKLKAPDNFAKKYPLHEASKLGVIETVHTLIAANFDVDIKDQSGRTALHCGAEKGHLTVVTALISAGAEINIKDKFRRNALHYSAKNGHLDIVKSLIAAGSDINKKDEYGSTALHYSSEYDHLDIVKALIIAGADINTIDENKHTALHLSAENDHLTILEALISAGAVVNIKNKDRFTPLHLAYMLNKKDSCKVLIKYTILWNYGISKPAYLTFETELSLYWDMCEEEVNRIREIKLGSSSVSIFDFLTSTDKNKVAFYSSEDSFGIRKDFQKVQLEEILSVYSEDFEIQFRKGIKRSFFLLKTQELMSSCFSKVLPLEIRRKISEHLTNYDLKNFIYSVKCNEISKVSLLNNQDHNMFNSEFLEKSPKTKTLKRKYDAIH